MANECEGPWGSEPEGDRRQDNRGLLRRFRRLWNARFESLNEFLRLTQKNGRQNGNKRQEEK